MRPCGCARSREIRTVILIVAISLGVTCAIRTEAADPYFDARGFQPNRDLFSELPFEHVDPMTGNVLLTFTDLVLPGNAGFDLRIQRTYNSKIYNTYSNGGGFTLDEDSWAGIGWRLHMGRVINPNDVSPGPIIEMPDGSRHQLYLHMDGNAGHYMTKDYWTYEKANPSPILRLPNGLRYTFGHPGATASYVTEILDPFGNRIVVQYAAPPAPVDVIASITQDLVGSQSRTVTFTYNQTLPGGQGPQAAGSLASMTFNSRTWTYTQRLTPWLAYTQLVEVAPPVGPSWTFDYDDNAPLTSFMMTHLKTPNGGEIDYTFVPQVFYIGSTVVYSPALTRRDTSGQNVPQGVRIYVYSSSTDKNQTVITSAADSSGCDVKMTYTFLGIGPKVNQDPWAIGALDNRVTANAAGMALETEDFTWQASVPISNVPESGSSPQTHVALLQQRSVSRSGRTYSTSYAYSTLPYSPARPNNFNDYGRAHTISESGDSSRTTARTFFYGSGSDPSFGNYIVDKIESETVQAPAGGEAFAKSFTYDAATGFKKSDTIHGITMTYTPHASGSGNVGKAKDENNHETAYDYSWAIPDQIDTPEYSITRSINTDSTVAWEKQRGFTTSFLYDALSRPTKTTPPAGNPATTTYDNVAGTYFKVTRGSSAVTTSLDGFARPFGTSNTLGIKTRVDYDVCGRRVFESYAYTGSPVPTPGRTYKLDPLGRIVETIEPGNNGGTTSVKYAYSQGVDVTITDEEQRTTKQDWSAFGDPGDARLSSVSDAIQNSTSYTYNTVGSLKQVMPPTGPSRQWTYYAANESGGAHGQLKSETHPENGTVAYTYDAAGNLKTRTDAQGQVTTLGYDGNNRLTSVDRAGTAYDTQIAYDDSDNRTSLANGYVSSTFVYDAANRLTSRTDLLNGKSLGTGYSYDGNGNVTRITYPSQRKVDYTYDTENRISVVKSSLGPIYANGISYHASGALDKFTAGNGRVTDFTYNNRYRLKSLDVGAGLFKLDYAYDDVGNVTSIDDTRSGFDVGLVYDDLDRVKTVTGFGAGGFGYDSIGNRLSKTLGGATTNYSYSPSTNRLTSASGAEPDSFGYAANGGMTSNSQGTYTYTPDQMMETATVSGATTTYRYDGDDQRKQKIAGGVNRYYVHGGAGQLLGEYTDSCSSGPRSVRDYVYLGSRLLATIRDAPTVGVLATGSIAENAGAASIPVTVTTSDGCPTDTDITVSYATSNGTAQAGSDYTAVAGALTIPAGTPSGAGPAVSVPIINDNAIESSETFKLTLSNVLGATLGTAIQTMTITDNDTPVVAFTQPAATVGESGVWVTPRPTVSVTTGDGTPLAATATVKYATANGTAKAGLDYTAQSGTLTFAAGAPSGSTQQISITILQDGAAEPDETFKVTLSAPVNAALGVQKVNTVTIKDDEPSVQFLTATSAVDEGGVWTAKPTVSIVTWDGNPLPAVATVKYATANITAKAGTDYTSASGFLTFVAGSPSGSTQDILPTILQDAVVEPAETFKITLSAPVGAKLGSQKINTITIADDEPTFVFTAATASVSESGMWNVPKPTVAVITPGGKPLTGAVSVKYATSNVTAIAGTDYAAASGTLTFAAGLPSGSAQEITVAILQDALSEPDETFKITLSAAVGGKLGTPKINTVTILDDEPFVAFATAASSVSEAARVAKIQVGIVRASGEPIAEDAWVEFAAVDGTATGDGAPSLDSEDGDYSPARGRISFPAGTPSGSIREITIPIHDDVDAEGDETFGVRLATGSVRVGLPVEHRVTILDDDSSAKTVEIDALPFRITKAGRYRLGRDFTIDLADGPAISIEADAVFLDLAGLRIVNTAGAANLATAVQASNRRAIVIRNGVLQGFRAGVVLESEDVSAPGLHRVEDLLVLDSVAAGIDVAGRGSRVQFNRVLVTGVRQPSTAVEVRAIAVSGPDVRVLGNDVNETKGEAIHISDARGAEVRSNRIGNTDASGVDGIVAARSSALAVVDNRITGTEHGIAFDEQSSGRLSGNVMSGVVVPYHGVAAATALHTEEK